jgi:hypothetical protein
MNVRRASVLALAALLVPMLGSAWQMCCSCSRPTATHEACGHEPPSAMVFSCCPAGERVDAEAPVVSPTPGPSVAAPAVAEPLSGEPALAAVPTPSPLDPPLFRDDGLYTLFSVYLI